jgi:hypothetical protein
VALLHRTQYKRFPIDLCQLLRNLLESEDGGKTLKINLCLPNCYVAARFHLLCAKTHRRPARFRNRKVFRGLAGSGEIAFGVPNSATHPIESRGSAVRKTSPWGCSGSGFRPDPARDSVGLGLNRGGSAPSLSHLSGNLDQRPHLSHPTPLASQRRDFGRAFGRGAFAVLPPAPQQRIKFCNCLPLFDVRFDCLD